MPKRPAKLPFAATHVVKAAHVLTPLEKFVWLESWALDNSPDGAWISAGELARRLASNAGAVQERRNWLVQAALLFRVVRPRVEGFVATLPDVCVPRSQRPAPILIYGCAAQLDAIVGDVQAKVMHRWTYFVRAGATGPVKIGTTDNVTRRLRHLQAVMPDELTLLGQTDRIQEDAAHATWASLRIRGEWFRPTDDLLAWIAKTCEHESKLNSDSLADETRFGGGNGGTPFSSNLAVPASPRFQPPMGTTDGTFARTDGEDGEVEAQSSNANPDSDGDLPQSGLPQKPNLDSGELVDTPEGRAAFEHRLVGLTPKRAAFLRKMRYGA